MSWRLIQTQVGGVTGFLPILRPLWRSRGKGLMGLWCAWADESHSPSLLVLPPKFSWLLPPPGCLLLMNVKARTTHCLESHQNPIREDWGIFINSYAASKISTSYSLAQKRLENASILSSWEDFQKKTSSHKALSEGVLICFVLLYQNTKAWNFINKKYDSDASIH